MAAPLPATEINLNTNKVHGCAYILSFAYGGPSNGLPPVHSRIRINGNGATIARSSAAAGLFRIMSVAPAGDLVISDTTITGGSLAVPGLVGGGGIYNSGTLTLATSVIRGNVTNANGGGIYNQGALTLINSAVDANAATNYTGGGIYNFDGVVTVTNSTVSGNTSVQHGGGIVNESGSMGVIDSMVSRNSTDGAGGGILDLGGALTLTGTLITYNAAQVGGGILTAGAEVDPLGVHVGYAMPVAALHDTFAYNTPNNCTGPVVGCRG